MRERRCFVFYFIDNKLIYNAEPNLLKVKVESRERERERYALSLYLSRSCAFSFRSYDALNKIVSVIRKRITMNSYRICNWERFPVEHDSILGFLLSTHKIPIYIGGMRHNLLHFHYLLKVPPGWVECIFFVG